MTGGIIIGIGIGVPFGNQALLGAVGPTGDSLLLEDLFNILLEDGCKILLESTGDFVVSEGGDFIIDESGNFLAE